MKLISEHFLCNLKEQRLFVADLKPTFRAGLLNTGTPELLLLKRAGQGRSSTCFSPMLSVTGW